jgi:hypothetical protein
MGEITWREVRAQLVGTRDPAVRESAGCRRRTRRGHPRHELMPHLLQNHTSAYAQLEWTGQVQEPHYSPNHKTQNFHGAAHELDIRYIYRRELACWKQNAEHTRSPQTAGKNRGAPCNTENGTKL